MTVDDLMTLFALFTLTVQYHDHHKDQYHLDAAHVPNKTPLYITDILSLRGKRTVDLLVIPFVTVSIESNSPTSSYMSLQAAG